jgi:hypothetical protein
MLAGWLGEKVGVGGDTTWRQRRGSQAATFTFSSLVVMLEAHRWCSQTRGSLEAAEAANEPVWAGKLSMVRVRSGP